MEFKDIKTMSLDDKKLYLEELKAERQRIASGEVLRQQSGGFQAAAEAMMPYDPTGAFTLMDKRAKTDIDRQEMMMKGQYDPDKVRFKLASRLNSISGAMANLNANDPEYAALVAESAKIKAELQKDQPSIQAVYSDAVVPVTKKKGDATYESIQTLIKSATKESFEEVKSQVATDKGSAKLSAEQDQYIDGLLETKRKQLFPAAKIRPKTSIEETRKLALNALGELIKWSEASKLDPNVPSDLLLLAKIKSRDFANEAYMSDDANLSGDTVRKFFAKLTGFTELPKEDGVRFKAEIPAKYERAMASAKKYLGDEYFNTISKALYDNITETLQSYPLTGSRNLTGGLRTNLKKPVASAYKNYAEYKKAMQEYRAKGGK